MFQVNANDSLVVKTKSLGSVKLCMPLVKLKNRGSARAKCVLFVGYTPLLWDVRISFAFALALLTKT
jgi:hypothetical protein